MTSSYPQARPRRLRQTAGMRRLVAEHRLLPSQLILPVFIREGLTEPNPIESMPGVVQHSLLSLREVIRDARRAGLGGVMLFGIPEHRDPAGSGSTDENGILNRAIRTAVDEAHGELVVQSDLCLDEFTSHGHCGLLDDRDRVDNDATLRAYCTMAIAQAVAGSHMLGLSGMMDGQVAAVRGALDAAGHHEVAILAYSAKYASAFYGPFREAVDSQLTGDRKTYQLNPANSREGLREVELDVAEGADIVMVKPAGPYLDIVSRVAERSTVPVWAYQVSGEYSMVEAAAQRGWIDRDRAIMESLIGIRRAGADAILTYWALDAASLLATRG